MTEQQYFNELDSLIDMRNRKIKAHFHNNFLEGYMDAEEREWYLKNIGPFDDKIVSLANEIATALKINVTFKKISEVFKNRPVSAWYNKLKMQKNRDGDTQK